jgi:cytochrome c554/c'-like protein
MIFRKDRNRYLPIIMIALLFFVYLIPGFADEEPLKSFVGSETCGECHESQLEAFRTHAKKSTSFESIRIMQKGLTDAEKQKCYACHTTGYGARGGFISESETPHLKNAGCEVCHGPGSLHIDSEDPEDIVSMVTIETCNACHSSERVDAFKFKPLLYGGSH